MVLVGGVVTLVILGFTLLGEGLRRRLEGEAGQRTSWLTAYSTGGQHGSTVRFNCLETRRRSLYAGGAVLCVFVVFVAGWWLLRRDQPAVSQGFSLIPPGGHLWATARHDPYGTLTITGTGPVSPTVVWSLQFPGGLTGGPVVGADGVIYVAVADGALAAVDADGALRWQTKLPAPTVGTPALGADGTIYVAVTSPGLVAVAPDGTARWHFTSPGRRATSGPVVGVDGMVYFTRVDRIQALNPDGSERWLSPPVEGAWEEPPRLSPDGELIFLRANVFAVEDGALCPCPWLPFRKWSS